MYHTYENISFKLIDPTLPMPHRADGNTGIDLYSRLEVVINPHTMALVPLNVIVLYGMWHDNKELMHARGTFLLPRSSLFSKHGVMLVNSMGVIDASYRGPEDEVKAALFNLTDKATVIPRGERICQLVCLTYETPEVIIVNEDVLQTKTISPSRGGFGSTG